MKSDHKDVIRCDQDIKDYIVIRMHELKLSLSDVCAEAKAFKVTLHKSCLSRWLTSKGQGANIPTQRTILWLCHRLGIKLTLKIELIEDFDYEIAKIDAQKLINKYRKL